MSFFTGTAHKAKTRQIFTFSTPAPQNEKNELPRLILSEQGTILFANESFINLYNGPSTDLAGIPSSNIFDNIKLKEGRQSLSLLHNKTKLTLHFDKIETNTGKHVFVASAEKKTERDTLLHFVAEKIQEEKNQEKISDAQKQKSSNHLLNFDLEKTTADYRTTLTRQRKRLSEAEAIANIGQWHWRIGQDSLAFSDQLYVIFGLDADSFSPTLKNITDMIHKDDADRMMQVFQRAIIEQQNYDMDFRINTLTDETRYIRCEGRCQTDREGDVIALYGIMQDVTETRQREIDLRNAKDTAERAYAAKSQFLANMSHELRTPLNAVIGFSEMMERQLLGPIGTEKYLEYIKGIRESGEHLLDLISDILDMSKIEAGKYELALEQFNIAKTIRLAAHMIEGRALDNAIKINMHINNEDLKIVADRRAVMQMVLNLLSNAVKFSKQNGTINVTLTEHKESLTICVEDNGIGIPANKLANITMPFEQAQVDYKKEYEGTGLGLSITKELSESHGGSLDIQSTLDVGTSVTIRLPYKAQIK